MTMALFLGFGIFASSHEGALQACPSGKYATFSSCPYIRQAAATREIKTAEATPILHLLLYI